MHEEPLSKTKKKQMMTELQGLGAELVALSGERLAAMQLPEALADAVRAAQRITAHEGRRRQMQYIGRLMREVDPAPIRERLDAWRASSRTEIARQHALERWRERLIEDDAALTEFATKHRGADMQVLRGLIRNARKQSAEDKPPRAFRELFRVIRETAG